MDLSHAPSDFPAGLATYLPKLARRSSCGHICNQVVEHIANMPVHSQLSTLEGLPLTFHFPSTQDRPPRGLFPLQLYISRHRKGQEKTSMCTVASWQHYTATRTEQRATHWLLDLAGLQLLPPEQIHWWVHLRDTA